MNARIPVAIVGAGPYGLALAHVLAGQGVMPQVLGVPMDTWATHMPGGMFLKSEGRASSIVASDERLTLGRYCAEVGAEYGDVGVPVPLETFVSYGRWFQEKAVPEVVRVEVEEIRQDTDGFELALQDGEELHAERVVVATGVRPFAYMPAELRALPAGLRSHTIEHHDLTRFRGKRVAVIGCGQSALESAALIHEAGGVPTVVARAERAAWNPPPAPESTSLYSRVRHPYAPLGPGWPLWTYSNLAWAFPALPERLRRRKAREVLGPAGGWWLRDRVESHIPLLLGRTIERCDSAGDAVRLVLHGPDGIEEVEADHVLAATGYRVDVSRLTLLDPKLREQVATSHGAPVLSRGLESSVQGLFFTGIAAVNHFGPLMRFVCGAEFAARRLAAGAAIPRGAGGIRRRYPVNAAEETG
jgi:FAD-dependent urate hydroxylase